jgi:NAD(P)-dependent dehydrogenase (short-subunit alcohol dehydrogenase family)
VTDKYLPQHQDQQPGLESEMIPKPQYDDPAYKGSEKLKNKTAIITGGDSGIGKSVAVLFAKEGADLVISYLNEHQDAEDTRDEIQELGRQCLLIPGDIGNPEICEKIVNETISKFRKIDILVNNAAEQHTRSGLEDIDPEDLNSVFRTNIFSMFYLTKASLRHMKENSVIINTASITAYRGHEELIDYATTKGAIVAFTRSLSKRLADRKIRVNGVAPGPIWTPLIPASFDDEKIKNFGKNTTMGRAGQPFEVATCFVFLASKDSSYITGQFLHPNGGEVLNT